MKASSLACEDTFAERWRYLHLKGCQWWGGRVPSTMPSTGYVVLRCQLCGTPVPVKWNSSTT